MNLNGVWVGWGVGDNSLRDFTVRNFKGFARRMYRSYMGDLADTNVFDQQLYDRLVMMQDKLVAAGKLTVGKFLRGILDLETEYASGFKKRPPAALPIIFTVEGHMSNMFLGPCASTAATLEAQGVCHWKPVFYDCTALPFNNKSGVDALVELFSSTAIEGPPVDPNNPDGPKVMWPFGPEVHSGVIGFSQGAMVVSDFLKQHVMPYGSDLNWRLANLKRTLCFGNPRRETDKECSWARNPTKPGTEGIMGKGGLFITTGTPLEGRHAEHANSGDLFAENAEDAEGLDKTAIARIVTENSWVGGQAAILARVLTLLGNVPGESIPALMAAVSAIMFLAANPNPHYGTVSDPGDVEWMRGVAA